jgi:hypothetical protein
MSDDEKSEEHTRQNRSRHGASLNESVMGTVYHSGAMVSERSLEPPGAQELIDGILSQLSPVL